MIKVLLLLLMTFSLNAVDNLKKPVSVYDTLMEEYNNFSPEQVETMIMVYDYATAHNLKWSATAIAWEESKFGLFKVPVGKSNDYGLMKINIYWFLKGKKINDTIWNRSKFGTKLVVNDKFSMDEAIKILRTGERIKKSWESYRRVWSYYNSGTVDDKAGQTYADRISIKVKVLKHIFKYRIKHR